MRKDELFLFLFSQDDVLENSFNILRMFNGIYGASAAPAMLVSNCVYSDKCFEHGLVESSEIKNIRLGASIPFIATLMFTTGS